MRPRFSAVDTPARDALREQLKRGLTDAGWRLCDVEALSRLVLGRSGLTGSADAVACAVATAADYLACASTVDHAVSDWVARVAPALGGAGALVVDLAAAQSEAARRKALRVSAAAADEAEVVAFAAERERRVAEVQTARGGMGRPSDPDGRSVARGLREWAERLGRCRSREHLDAAWAEAQEWTARARAWPEARDVAKRQAEEAAAAARQQRRAAADSEKRRRAAEQDARKAAQLARRESLAGAKQYRDRLAALASGSPAGGLLYGLRDLGLVRWRSNEWEPAPAYTETPFGPVERPKTLGERFGDFLERVTQPPGWWVEGSSDRTVTEADAAAMWERAYDEADRLVVELGGRPKRRPRLRPARSGPARATGQGARRSAKSAVSHQAKPRGTGAPASSVRQGSQRL